jgi:hypothetical protein
MSKPDEQKTKRIVKTGKADQRRVKRLARRFGVAPIDIRELQGGFVVELPAPVAEKMIGAGFAKSAKKKPRSQQERVNGINTADTADTEVTNTLVDAADNTTEEIVTSVDVIPDDKDKEELDAR